MVIKIFQQMLMKILQLQPYDSYGHYKAEAELIFKEEFEKKVFQ